MLSSPKILVTPFGSVLDPGLAGRRHVYIARMKKVEGAVVPRHAYMVSIKGSATGGDVAQALHVNVKDLFLVSYRYNKYNEATGVFNVRPVAEHQPLTATDVLYAPRQDRSKFGIITRSRRTATRRTPRTRSRRRNRSRSKA